jgi:S1-C subfamily serine protease
MLDTRGRIRLIAVGIAVGLGLFWAGAQWGPRNPVAVDALSQTAQPASLQTASPGALMDEESVNVRVYRAASPAVANIVTRAVQYDWFMNPVPSEGAGSGFVIDDQGHILTNYHVVGGAQAIEVTLGDSAARNRFPARFIGGDSRNDVALIKIDPGARKLTKLTLGDSSRLQVGQRVLAIGNPFGRFQSTLTTGVVSALGRTVQTGEQTFIDDAIQTDAAINQGNSGGPLLNSAGQVIGINTAIFTPTGATAGIGFAIPISTARKIAEDLIRDGVVHRAYLGVNSLPLSRDLAQALDLPVSEGFLVERVVEGGPAARAGVRGGSRVVRVGFYQLAIGGDIIVAVDGKPINESLDITLALNRKRPGDSITLTLYRDGKKMDVRVTLGDAPSSGRR